MEKKILITVTENGGNSFDLRIQTKDIEIKEALGVIELAKRDLMDKIKSKRKKPCRTHTKEY